MLHHFHSDSFLRVQTFDDIKGIVIESEIFLISDNTECCEYKIVKGFKLEHFVFLNCEIV